MSKTRAGYKPSIGIVALDDFAGTGWGVACKWLGIEEHGVEIMPEARATREANGMDLIGADVWDSLREMLAKPWHYDLYISSPPCQTFSQAGSGTGRKALDEVLGLIESKAYMNVEQLKAFGERHDPRTALVIVPLVRVYRDLPRYVVFEQVPPVLPVWRRMAEEMEKWGYSTWTGILYAEQYGVPQTRKRAVLIAKRDPDVDGPTRPPAPTHSRYYGTDKTKLDEGVLPYVTMAQALEWGMTERPYLSIAPGTGGGGTDPAGVGGSGARKSLEREKESGHWAEARPATTVTASFSPDIISGPGGSGTRPTDVSRHRQDRPGSVKITAEEAATLQSYPKQFTFVGNKGKQFLQIGNAVPPLLAKAILSELLGVSTSDERTSGVL